MDIKMCLIYILMGISIDIATQLYAKLCWQAKSVHKHFAIANRYLF